MHLRIEGKHRLEMQVPVEAQALVDELVATYVLVYKAEVVRRTEEERQVKDHNLLQQSNKVRQ